MTPQSLPRFTFLSLPFLLSPFEVRGGGRVGGKHSSPALSSKSLVTTSAGPFTQRTVQLRGQLHLGWNVRGEDRGLAEVHGPAEGGRAFSLSSQLPAKRGSTELFTFPPLIAASQTYQLFYVSWV